MFSQFVVLWIVLFALSFFFEPIEIKQPQIIEVKIPDFNSILKQEPIVEVKAEKTQPVQPVQSDKPSKFRVGAILSI